MRKNLLYIFVIILAYSCSDYKKTNKEINLTNCSETIKSVYLDTLLEYENNDVSGPIKIRFDIESIQTGKIITQIDSVLIISLNQESELIEFNNNFAFKLFHVEAKEYNNIIHLVKFDLFIRDSELNCFKRQFSSSYDLIHFYENDYGFIMGSFSKGYHKSNDYIKVKSNISRLK